ncbi:hypothetical protein [Ruminococcus sp.]|uniref:hypothetical protein n=1 Tax=Ruminococcus sp. TaxID=41978 RepID=UPI0025FB1BD3|nr:hypothetical protein [Ruminococcus sp.]
MAGQGYVWYISPDDDSPYNILNVISDDKSVILACPLGTGKSYVISKGRCFGGKQTSGCWERYLLPFEVPDVITPKFAEQLILFALSDTSAEAVPADDVPV